MIGNRSSPGSAAPLAFLRSPPFPDVAVAVAAVSGVQALEDRTADLSSEFDAIRGARVGGAFWGRPAGGARVVVQGPLPADVIDRSGVVVIQPDTDPWSVLEDAELLICAPGGEIELVAWLRGVAVSRPDGSPVPAAVLAERATAAVGGARYRNPFTGSAWSAAEAIAQLADWRRLFEANRGIAEAAGMARWKRRQIARFLWDGRRAPGFFDLGGALARAKGSGAVAVWPSRIPTDAREQAASAGVALVQVEDGFIRSRGLGSDLNVPWSVVVDRSGIYYRPDAPSDLETILADHAFAPALTARAAALRGALCEGRVAKYGGGDRGMAFDRPPGRRCVLAVGQVEDDLSVRHGGAGIARNLDFLARVRAAEPGAYIVYRPHPDVLAGHRAGDVAPAKALRYADRVDAGGSVLAAIEAVDAVHVLSSLTGFEALLRGRDVVVHGAPFYAGWGLTRDLAPQGALRGRRLTLDELVAGALIVYPRYLDPMTNLPCPPEVLVSRFAEASAGAPWLVRARRVQGRVSRALSLIWRRR